MNILICCSKTHCVWFFNSWIIFYFIEPFSKLAKGFFTFYMTFNKGFLAISIGCTDICINYKDILYYSRVCSKIWKEYNYLVYKLPRLRESWFIIDGSTFKPDNILVSNECAVSLKLFFILKITLYNWGREKARDITQW